MDQAEKFYPGKNWSREPVSPEEVDAMAEDGQVCCQDSDEAGPGGFEMGDES